MRTIAIGMLVFAFAHSGAAAQTAGEQAQILRGFQQSVADYTQRHQCLDLFPEAINAATPAPRIFTLPVAMVFRQLIAQALADHDVSPAVEDVPKAVTDALPQLPAPLEYHMAGHDLVVRDRDANVVIGVLRDAVSPVVTVRR